MHWSHWGRLEVVRDRAVVHSWLYVPCQPLYICTGADITFLSLSFVTFGPFRSHGEAFTLASTTGQQVCRRGRLSDDYVPMGSREI
jgi:hypothetical protein